MNDELDEMFFRGLIRYTPEISTDTAAGWAVDQKTVTFIWDIKDLEHPVLTGRYKSPVVAIDHNLYVHVSSYIPSIFFPSHLFVERPGLRKQLQERAARCQRLQRRRGPHGWQLLRGCVL
jgi:hypothetical protein